ncbi:MAG TPA: small basic family protein [Candidatus Eisenbacteria bacterium]|nr:small basic family protein [Candidatus Eisenbacteria bacterium]
MTKSAARGSREAVWIVLFAALFAIVGILLGLNAPVQIPPGYARYTAVMILAALDSIFGAIKAWLNGNFENRVFISGLLVNSVVAGALTYLGDKLGVELYFAAIVAFGVRIFENIAVIRRHLL